LVVCIDRRRIAARVSKNLPQIAQIGADKKNRDMKPERLRNKAWTGSTETAMNFHDRGQIKMIRVSSREFAAKFPDLRLSAKSAAEPVLPIASC
jgi:hypothetical protein